MDDDEVVEQDPEGRYYRYRETVGRGRFKQVWKAFDTHIGIDVAWSKISSDTGTLRFDQEQLAAVVHDIQTGLELEHPNIIKCFKCWADARSINLITELFTSGNLRQYRNLHKHLDLKAVKRMARQILRGLEYLHSMQPPVTHGDLRCDKIYVNGHSGEIKIGDLGLATLLPYRWQEPAQPAQLSPLPPTEQQHEQGQGQQGQGQQAELPPELQEQQQQQGQQGQQGEGAGGGEGGEPGGGGAGRSREQARVGDPLDGLEGGRGGGGEGGGGGGGGGGSNGAMLAASSLGEDGIQAHGPRPSCESLPQGPFDAATDIFAFGLCLLELLTLKQLDPQHCTDYNELLMEVPDEEARAFVGKCVAPEPERPTAVELLEDPFLSLKKAPAPQGEGGGGQGDQQGAEGGGGMGRRGSADLLADKRKTEEGVNKTQSESGAPIAVGKLRGEDYNFEFHGKVKDGKMHFRLVMTEAAAAEPQADHPPFMRTIDFVFDPEIDTADNLAAEISENFNLSPTDTEICAAALREWLAKEMPEAQGAQK